MGGIVAATTASFFTLDPSLTIPQEPILDLVPGYSPLRITLDMVDGESIVFEYEVTEHAIQDALDVTSNCRKRLETMTIQGTMSALPPLLSTPITVTDSGGAFTGGAPPVPGSFLRLDLIRMRNLQFMADQRRPIMVVTPRFGMPRAFMTTVAQNWTPANTESTSVTIALKEARLVDAVLGDLLVPDFPAQPPGNNAAAGGGASASSSAGESATRVDTLGVPPSVGATA
jgi:hypothetical protein